jgi:hypothetical protein
VDELTSVVLVTRNRLHVVVSRSKSRCFRRDALPAAVSKYILFIALLPLPLKKESVIDLPGRERSGAARSMASVFVIPSLSTWRHSGLKSSMFEHDTTPQSMHMTSPRFSSVKNDDELHLEQ